MLSEREAGTISQTVGTSAATAPTGNTVSARPAVANALGGTWMNVDSGTGGLVKLIIDGLAVHPFGGMPSLESVRLGDG